jgi:hypothetical protein
LSRLLEETRVCAQRICIGYIVGLRRQNEHRNLFVSLIRSDRRKISKARSCERSKSITDGVRNASIPARLLTSSTPNCGAVLVKASCSGQSARSSSLTSRIEFVIFPGAWNPRVRAATGSDAGIAQ